MKNRRTVSGSWVGTILVLAAFAVFASSPAKAVSDGPEAAGIKCALGEDGSLIRCTWK